MVISMMQIQIRYLTSMFFVVDFHVKHFQLQGFVKDSITENGPLTFAKRLGE